MSNDVEETLINNIKRLRVLTPSDHDNMDDQGQDGNTQTEQSSVTSKTDQTEIICSRNSDIFQINVTEDIKSSDESESSLDDSTQCQMLCYGSQSDSDDIKNVWHQHSWRMSTAPILESDSVNENFHPIREQRRKRKFKRMIVDSHPTSTSDEKVLKWSYLKCGARRCRKSCLSRHLLNVSFDNRCTVENIWKELIENPGTLSGKRKRSIKDKMAECSSADKRANFDPYQIIENSSISPERASQNHLMECDGIGYNVQREPNSSGISSSDSECGILTNDEGREADDEQSDCYHESPPSGILVNELPSNNIDAYQKHCSCVATYGSESLQFKHGLDTWKKREIASGRRRLTKCEAAHSYDLNDQAPLPKTEHVQGEISKKGSKKKAKIALHTASREQE